jgi:SARP family transcriptional regulator, regulator of embCAB operon
VVSQQASTYAFGMLGPLTVARDGQPLHVGGPKPRLLLGALLLSTGRVVSVDRLTEILWGPVNADGRVAALHVHVARLRSALGAGGSDLIETVRPGYRIAVDESCLDLLHFRRLAQQARSALADGDQEHAASLFREALALPRGRLLEDLAGNDAVDQEALVFDRIVRDVSVEALECELKRGRHDEVIHAAERLTSEDPYDERACGLLVLALYRSGRQVDALRAYERLRSTLGNELGVDPSPDMQDLERRLLRHDADLAVDLLPVAPGAPSTRVRSSRVQVQGWLIMGDLVVPLARPVTTIGRLPTNGVVVADPDVSRHHADIRRNKSGFVLVDVGSTNGTSVNGQRVAEHRLRDGDEIQVGESSLVFVDRRPPDGNMDR